MSFDEATERSLFGTVVDATGVGLILLDAEARVLCWSRWMVEASGIAAESALGSTLEDLFPVVAGRRLPRAIQDALQWSMSSTLSRAFNGSPLPLHNRSHSTQTKIPMQQSISVTPVKASDSSRYCLIEIHDITGSVNSELTMRAQSRELQSLAEDLGRSNDELQHFAYVASHDLREPLRAIASFSALLEKRYAGDLDDTALEYIGFLIDGAKRMDQLILGIVEYSRVETRGNEFTPTDCNVALAEALQNLRSAIDECGAEITSSELPRALADEVQLCQLFQNLIANAIKFRGDEAPRIHIDTGSKDELLEISISDNGIGIEEAAQQRIFQIFQRLHTQREYPGSGIGLSVCKKIVERHGGTMRIDSELGEGTTFCFTLRPVH
jgi:signal transduction histidine kinase